MSLDINYIIRMSLKGDKNFQNILIKKLNPLIYGNIYKFWDLKNPIIEDLAQEGYEVILESIKTFDTTKNVHFLHYVKIKLKYFYLNFYKDIKTKEAENENLEFDKTIIRSDFDILENLIIREEISELMLNIKKLSETEQKILYLYYYDNLSMIQISENLTIPYRTVISKKYNAIKSLKNLMQ